MINNTDFSCSSEDARMFLIPLWLLYECFRVIKKVKIDHE